MNSALDTVSFYKSVLKILKSRNYAQQPVLSIGKINLNNEIAGSNVLENFLPLLIINSKNRKIKIKTGKKVDEGDFADVIPFFKHKIMPVYGCLCEYNKCSANLRIQRIRIRSIRMVIRIIRIIILPYLPSLDKD